MVRIWNCIDIVQKATDVVKVPLKASLNLFTSLAKGPHTIWESWMCGAPSRGNDTDPCSYEQRLPAASSAMREEAGCLSVRRSAARGSKILPLGQRLPL